MHQPEFKKRTENSREEKSHPIKTSFIIWLTEVHNTEKRVQTPQDLCMSFRIEPYKLFFVTYEDPKGYDWYFDKHSLEPKDNSVI